jgi:hypothetical protein
MVLPHACIVTIEKKMSHGNALSMTNASSEYT